MKKSYSFLSIFCLLFSYLQAQTFVSGSVYGQWTLANSPYIVQSNIVVAPGDVLEIEKGVEVIFQGWYQMTVYGVLDAVGTANQPISFHAQDTTGWSDKTQPLGGWAGMYFQNSTIPNDSSSLTYCNIQDLKSNFSAVGVNTQPAGIQVERSMKFSHCKISHSINKTLVTGYTIKALLQPNQTMEIADCEFFDNHVSGSVVELDNYFGGYSHIHHNHFHHNYDCVGVGGMYVSALIEDNEWNDNIDVSDVGGGPISIVSVRTTIRHNKFHHNSSNKKAAITCMSGKTEIDGNLICNNLQQYWACGYDKGAAGMHLSASYGGPNLSWDSTLYVVHNNIIANNEAYSIGGGIAVYDARAYIMNNHIINNKSGSMGSGIYGFGANMQLYVKNNLFYGNVNSLNQPTNSILYTHDIMIAGGTSLLFDYNWIENSVGNTVAIDTSFVFGTMLGDTIHNIKAANPQMVAPTSSYGIAYNALTANFGLSPSSGCINAGDSDTTACYVSDYDYALNPRQIGRIDIGAFEYKNFVGVEMPQTQENELILYPNPTQNEVNFLFPQNKGTLIMMDNLGRLIWQKNTTQLQESFSFNHLPKGIYHFMWQGDKEIQRKTVILE